MGYESRLYLVERTRVHGLCGRPWLETIATFNLGKVYIVSDKMTRYPPTDGFVFADDGNTEILEDEYGSTLKAIPLEDAIKILEEASAEDSYRRFAPCIGLLKGINTDEWRDIHVLHYGY